ncbi:response regulator [Bacteroides sp. 214]|uniref:hybrid sensor histidine kinase/response regulator transcription factor n=1 Tax=Bacteroides sp. 214 TaxID=2302935 RepID=UPI0013D0421F|nr:response regulator [Bacteroides sp. 214]NDW11617.1 response regulator [Bacteroides sp. 214]
MKKILLFLIFLLPIIGNAQNYRHLTTADGLSDRKVYAIKKDHIGYMWFLTHDGINRYNGTEFKHYNLIHNNEALNSLQDLNWLHLDKSGTLWETGKRGRVFKYEALVDSFKLVYEIPKEDFANNPVPITYSFIDSNNFMWLCSDSIIYQYHIDQKKAQRFPNIFGTITCIEERFQNEYIIGTTKGILHVKLNNNSFNIISHDKYDYRNISEIKEIYYDPNGDKIIFGTYSKGVFVYDFQKDLLSPINIDIKELNITRIILYKPDEVLIATDGFGVLKLNLKDYSTTRFITADYNKDKSVSNVIKDIFVDDAGKIWIVNFPAGITIWDERYSVPVWYKHSIGNNSSLVNDCVNAVLEDHEGDIWFATNNGISLYESKTGKWKILLSSFSESTSNKQSKSYFSLCEVAPGYIYAGGYNAEIQLINKKSFTAKLLKIDSEQGVIVKSGNHISSILKGTQGNIWIGDYKGLQRTRFGETSAISYKGLDEITVIEEKDADNLWIGTGKGLYSLNKRTNEYTKMNTPVESAYIYDLCQAKEKLYIGTNGSGLFVYDIASNSYKHYHKDNCALISDNIYTILADDVGDIILATGSGLTRFYTRENFFHNWTKEQGLTSEGFNVSSGVFKDKKTFIIGSNSGAIELSKDLRLPTDYSSKMIFTDFTLFYQPKYPGQKGSPLKKDINITETLKLKHNENAFSFKVSSINFDNPSNILYTWKLKGYFDEWVTPTRYNIIRFTNLNPGKYVLSVRAVTKETGAVEEERTMNIHVTPPITRTPLAYFLYILTILGIIVFIMRMLYHKKQLSMQDDKLQFFINTAHDIRTPLTLVKAPLDELASKEQLSEEGQINVKTAMRNINVLLRMSNNLINYEKTNFYSSELNIAEYELNSFVKDITRSFELYAESKSIIFTYESNFDNLNVWFDKEKMTSILTNIVSNAMKYTLEGGTVLVYVQEKQNSWTVGVKDTGIGIPAKEKKKMFEEHFRGSNAINYKISGSGIGMMLTHKFVKAHNGKIVLESEENKGTNINFTFEKGYKHLKNVHMIKPSAENEEKSENIEIHIPEGNSETTATTNGYRLLIVEDNDELRNYLRQILQVEHLIQVCENGKEAMLIVKEYMPDLIISDIMMPEMRGDELCSILKHDIDTSHIPIILLTALSDERNKLKGIQTGADAYIGKPFNVDILKATVNNMLHNRAILQKKYANLELHEDSEDDCLNCNTSIDWKFISNIKEHVEKHMEEPHFNVDTLCALMNMSRTSFYNKVKALTDTSPSDYVRLIKLKKAAELLKEGEHTVTEVAEMTGFNDAKYFREVFKKHFDVSPSKYRG